TNALHGAHRVLVRTYHEVHVQELQDWSILCVEHKGAGTDFRSQFTLFGVADHPDNLAPSGIAPAYVDPLAERVLVGEERTGEFLVDDYDFVRIRRVGCIEEPALQQRNAHGLKIISAHVLFVCVGLLALTSFNFYAAVRAPSGQRQRMDQARGLHSGKSANPVHDLLQIGELLPGIGIAGRRRPHRHGQKVIGVKPFVDIDEANHAAQEQSCARQQYQRDGDFTHHQRLSQALAARAASALPPALLQAIVQASPQQLQDRRESEDKPGDERDQKRKRKNAAIQVNSNAAGHTMGQQPGERLKTSPRQQNPQSAARERKQGALGEELAGQSRAISAKRSADGNLLFARGGTSQQKVGRVGACDQEHGNYAGEQHQQQRTGGADQQFLQRRDHNIIEPFIVVLVTGQNARQSSAGLDQVESRAQPANARQKIQADGRCGPQRHDDVKRLAHAKAVRKNADHGKHRVIQSKLLPNGREAALKVLAPERLRKHGNRVGALWFLLKKKSSSRNGRDPHGGKKVRR